MPRPSSSFRRLALLTTGATYALILVGGLVRASGAGLGCPDWPRCFGSWIPPRSAADLPAAFDVSQFNPTLMWTEYVNRLLGVTVGLLIFATLVSAYRGHRHTPQILWPTLAAFLLVGFQGWLGGLVVRHELEAWIVTVHLLVALVIVSLLLYATVYAAVGHHVDRRARAGSRHALVRSVLALIVLTLAQVTLGAQVRGRVDDALTHGTPRDQALATVGAVDVLHRDLSLAVFGVTLLVLLVVWARHAHERRLVRATIVVCALVVAQMAVGASMAYMALVPPAQVAHLSVASLVLGAETVLLLLAWWLPQEPVR
ncbi:MAG: COX15/CtaA family protein [Acidobacteriota bacterium]